MLHISCLFVCLVGWLIGWFVFSIIKNNNNEIFEDLGQGTKTVRLDFATD